MGDSIIGKRNVAHHQNVTDVFLLQQWFRLRPYHAEHGAQSFGVG